MPEERNVLTPSLKSSFQRGWVQGLPCYQNSKPSLAAFLRVGVKVAPGSSDASSTSLAAPPPPQESIFVLCLKQKSTEWLELAQGWSHSYQEPITVSLVGQT